MRYQVLSVGEDGREDDGDYLDRAVEANDAEHAARVAVSRWWNEDPDDNPPRGMLVKVSAVPENSGASWARYRVSGEFSIDWIARPA